MTVKQFKTLIEGLPDDMLIVMRHPQENSYAFIDVVSIEETDEGNDVLCLDTRMEDENYIPFPL